MYFSVSKQHFDRTSWYQGGLVSVVLIVFAAILAITKCFCRLISRAKLFYREHWNCVSVWLFTVKTLLFREISTSQLAFYIIFTRPSVCICIFFSRLSIRLRFLSKGLGESWISPFVTLILLEFLTLCRVATVTVCWQIVPELGKKLGCSFPGGYNDDWHHSFEAWMLNMDLIWMK